MAEETIIERAVALWRQGLTPLPCGNPAVGGGKAPCVQGGWKPWQTKTQASEDEVRVLFADAQGVGLVCSGGLLVVDIDHDADGAKFAAFRAATDGIRYALDKSPNGIHVLVRADEDFGKTKSGTGDILCGGRAFVRVYGDPGEIPWVTGGEARRLVEAASPGAADPPAATGGNGSLLAALKAQGWRVGAKAANGWFSLTNGTKTAAISSDGSVAKMFSTTMCETPATEPVRPAVTCAEELLASDEELPEPILPFVRRGSVASLSGDPKAGKTWLACRMALKAAAAGRVVAYCDLENGARLFAHRLRNGLGRHPRSALRNIHYVDCTDDPTTACIAAALESVGGPVDLLFVDPLGLLFAGDGVEDESSNAQVSAWFLRFRREVVRRFGCATVILHHQPKSGANEKLCFAGAGASSLQRYVQSIARIREDKSGNFWFEALCREFDEPFKPFVIRKAPPPP